MKELFLTFSALLAIASGCSMTDNVAERAGTTKEGDIFFEGCAYNNPLETRITMGDLTPDGFPCLWSKGDVLGVRNNDNRIGNATLFTGAGLPDGKFIFSPSGSLPSDGDQLRLVYPDAHTMSFDTYTLPSEQTQAGGSGRCNALGSYAFACADIKYSSTSFPIYFKLKHVLSYIRLSLASSEYAGVAVSSVKIEAEGVALAGTYETDYCTLSITPKESGDYVKVTLADPVVISEAVRDIWFTVLPSDLSGKTLRITLEGTYKEQPVTIPMDVPGINLQQGRAYTINKTSLSHSDCLPWYEPVDGRKMVSGAHCYGPANCFLIQCKDGSTYKGGNYSPNPDIPSSVTFDYRVRGDFATAEDPTGYTFGWATIKYATTTAASGAYVARYTDFSNSGVNPTGFSFTVDRTARTVTVTNKSAHAGAPILVMKDSNDRIVWGWCFWNIAADGTRLESFSASGGQGTWSLANMDIGQPTTDYAAWTANKSTAGNPDLMARFIHRYQWGRYLPAFWNSNASLNFSDGSQSGNIPAVKGPVSMADALSHPYGLITASASGASISDWLNVRNDDLWGNASPSYFTYGTKTCFDPCPKGWRVPDDRTMTKVKEYSSILESKTTPGAYGWKVGNVLFVAAGNYSQTVGGTSTLTAGVNGGTVKGTDMVGSWWGNHVFSNAAATPTPCCWYGNADSGNNIPMVHSESALSNMDAPVANSEHVRTRAYPVRCQVDEDNR